MKRGHSSPSSNESTVPETAPTANRIAVPLASASTAQVLAIARPPVPEPSAITMSSGSATPTAAKTM